MPRPFESLIATAEPFDILVIGGGVVGAGIARDAALRGLRTALVEQYDFASGTSSRSSRLLHGGLRYLAQGRIGLVREASREKIILAQIAPHLCRPLAFLFPTYRGTPWPRWQLAVGVKTYDLLCAGRNFGTSQMLSRAATAAVLPGIRGDGLTGAVRYFDALTNDARLVIDTLRSADAAGATVANYVRFEAAEPQAARWRCRLRDTLNDVAVEVTARLVVNAAGPWADRFPQSGVQLRLTKGVHLVLDRPRLDVPDAVVLAEGSRILFVIPWGEHVIVGTTDTDYDGRPEDVSTNTADVEYLLDVVNRFFPSAGLTPNDILSSWAGLRPLIAAPRGGPSDISRKHEITSRMHRWLDVAGGKLTTYRQIAEEVVDRALVQTGTPARECSTASVPLLPFDDVEGISGIVPLPPTPSLVAHFCRKEWALRLDDVMLRRGGWHFDRPRAAALQLAEDVARWMAAELAWSPATRAAEVARYAALPR